MRHIDPLSIRFGRTRKKKPRTPSGVRGLGESAERTANGPLRFQELRKSVCVAAELETPERGKSGRLVDGGARSRADAEERRQGRIGLIGNRCTLHTGGRHHVADVAVVEAITEFAARARITRERAVTVGGAAPERLDRAAEDVERPV